MAAEGGKLVRDLPLPSGAEALIELNLLAWALVGGIANSADQAVGLRDAPGRQVDITRDGLTHVVRTSADRVVGEYWVTILAGGSGRHYPECPPADAVQGFDRYEVVLDEEPATTSNRYRAILTALSEQLSPEDREIMTNPLLVTDRSRAKAEWEGLRGAARLLAVKYLEPIGIDGVRAFDRMPNAGDYLYAYMDRQRYLLCCDASEACALLLAADIAATCATADGDNLITYGSYLARAADALTTGRWQNMRDVVNAASNEGFGEALSGLANSYYEASKRRRDEALDGPPDVAKFAHRLFNAAPYGAAACWLSNWLSAGDENKSAIARRASNAEEAFLRICDGIREQWLYWATGRILGERREIQKAQEDRDHDEVERILRNGEVYLLRPRSLRPFLLSERALDKEALWGGLASGEK